MANIHLLHELLMFSKTSNRKMTVEEAISEYFQYFIEDCRHTMIRDLIPLEGELRALMDNPLLDKTQNDIVGDMVQEIGLAKAEIAAENKDCEGPDDYYPYAELGYKLPF